MRSRMGYFGFRLALLLAASALSACDLPQSPAELADRLVQAAMEGNEQQLSPLLSPTGNAKDLSARALRLKFQGLVFRAVEDPAPNSTPRQTLPEGAIRAYWFLDVAISGTDRYAHAARLQIDCVRERRAKYCKLTDFVDLPWNFVELTSVDSELSLTDNTPRVWLMSSLDVLDPRINLFTGRREKSIAQAEALFRDWASREAPEARAVVTHLATQYELARILLDPRTEAIFWISHGSKGVVVDYQGFELAPVLRQLAPRSQAARIALISCQSRGILPPSSRLIDFDGKIDLTRALKSALRATSSADLRNTQSQRLEIAKQTFQGPEEKIQLARRLRATQVRDSKTRITPAVRIESREESLAILPGKRPFETQDTQQSIEIGVPLLTNRVIVNAGESYLLALTDIDLGDWEVLTPGWKFFTDSSGRPIGVTRRIIMRASP